MRIAIADTALDQLWVVYPGTRSYPLDDNITVRSLADFRHYTASKTTI